MRIALIALILVAQASCSHPEAPDDGATPARAKPSYDVAYQVTEGGFKGMYLFVDPTTGETWGEYRDDRDAVEKAGFGDPLAPCGRGSIDCYRAWGGRPLLSALPPPDFLNGEYSYSSRPTTFWTMACEEIRATSDEGATTSIVCPVVGLVAFSMSASGARGPAERFELRSFNGLFAQR
jgi:hypothetical protein